MLAPGSHRREEHGCSHAEFPEREAGRHGDRDSSTSPGAAGRDRRQSRSRCTSLIHRGRSSSTVGSTGFPRTSTWPASSDNPNHSRASPRSTTPQPASTNPGQTAAGSGPSASAAMPPGVATPPTDRRKTWLARNCFAGNASHLHRNVTRVRCEVTACIRVLPDQLLRLSRTRWNRELGPTPHADHPQFHNPRMANQSSNTQLVTTILEGKGTNTPPGGESSPPSSPKT